MGYAKDKYFERARLYSFSLCVYIYLLQHAFLRHFTVSIEMSTLQALIKRLVYIFVV